MSPSATTPLSQPIPSVVVRAPGKPVELRATERTGERTGDTVAATSALADGKEVLRTTSGSTPRPKPIHPSDLAFLNAASQCIRLRGR